MGALGFALPLSGFLYMLSKPMEIRDPQEVVSAIEQLNNLSFNVPTETSQDSDENNESEMRFPFLSSRPIQTANHDVLDDISFESSKAESTHPPDSSITNIHLDNHAKWLPGSDEYRASKELVIEQERDKNPPAEGNQQDSSIRMFVSNVKNALKENIMKRNLQLGSDIVTRRNTNKPNPSSILNHAQRKMSYIRLCKKATESALRNDPKDCILLPRDEFHVERLFKQTEPDRGDDTINVLERIETRSNDEKNDKDSNNGRHKPKDGAKPFVVSISNDSGVQLVNKLASMQVTTKTRR